ncbi:MAG TPA: carboxypeptidase regulatory-like domain-containing protein [Bryobacteraceae bacterium]|nr:carboxypeptidase regulatory-like domain-containing protein [Bryobacteraceae bacterium]
MKNITRSLLFVGLAAALLLGPSSALAQITTGTVTGRVVDSSGGVIPGAQVVLVSQSQNTRSPAVQTNGSGDYVVPNVKADTYKVEVTAPAFKTAVVEGIVVTGGDRVGVPVVTLQVGGTTDTVTVTAEAALLQTQSGERSYAIENKSIESLPIAHGNFTSVVAFVPGVDGGNGTSAGGTRLGGVGQNNIMMDGISAMDTGNNGQMISMNVESIGEVKVLTQGYQAEYGRSSGLQITAVTKSGTNQYHGAGYGIFTNTEWNSRAWNTQKNGDIPTFSHLNTYGYTIGGPVIIPKIYNGKNKFFFFYAHEFRPQSILSSGNVIRMRLPSPQELAGDFSQSRDNNGNPIPALKDAQNNGVPFQNQTIPQSRIYAPGLAVLSRYPAANLTQAPGTNYNYQAQPASYNQLTQQPAVRLDYQFTPNVRISAKYSGQIQRPVLQIGTIPGFNDAYVPYPTITNYGATFDWSITPSTFLEVTYGSIKNQLAGGGNGGLDTGAESNRLKSLQAFPMLYPEAGVVSSQYYDYQVLQKEKPVFWDGKSVNLPPLFGWGGLISGGPPNLQFPGWLNVNHTQDVAGSLTKVVGRHTFKGGLYLNHSYKAQNVGAGGVANLSFQGYVNFGNDTTNTLDSGFGYANAELGIFQQYLQASKFIEGDMVYNQFEGFLQDNWKVTDRLTLDYGLRLVNQQPQYDINGTMSNFFSDKWQASQAPVLYVAGCNNGQATCSGNARNAMDPRTGQIISAAGAANTQALIGTPVPGTGNPTNGIVAAGKGIAKTDYTWPTLVLGPRVGFAYDVTGKSNWVIRGGFGVFYDRPDGNTVFSIPGNPPAATAQDLRNGTLATLGSGGLSPQPVPALVTFQYNAKVPASLQWNLGIQKSLPFQMVADVSYVGNHGYDRLGALQGGDVQNQNAVDIGSAYQAKYQDPTLGAPAYPGASAYTTNLLRPYVGYSSIGQNTTDFWDTYHSMQVTLSRRFSHGLSFAGAYTYGISLKGNTGLVQRYVHNPDGSISLRSDQAQYEALNENLDRKPHFFKFNSTWEPPGISQAGGFVHQLTKDWQMSGIWTLASGNAYTVGYGYNSQGQNVNITGSPDFSGMVTLNNVGSGCSGNVYSEFNAAGVTGPTYGSTGLESGRLQMRGCATDNVDTSIVRRFRFWKFQESRRFEFRADIYNTLNTVQITGIGTSATFNNPAGMALQNSEFNASGAINPGKQLPKNAGFGAANNAAAMRSIQLELRFGF